MTAWGAHTTSGENVSEGQAKRVKGEKLCSLAEAKLRGGERINFPPLSCSSHPLYSPTWFFPPTSSSQRRLLSNRHAYSQKRKGTCSPLPLYKRPHCPITTEGMGLTPHFHFWSHNSSRSKPKSLHKQWRLISNDIARIILIPFRSSESLAISDQDDPTRWQHSRCPVTPPPCYFSWSWSDWQTFGTKVSTMIATPGFNMTVAELQTDSLNQEHNKCII